VALAVDAVAGVEPPPLHRKVTSTSPQDFVPPGPPRFGFMDLVAAPGTRHHAGLRERSECPVRAFMLPCFPSSSSYCEQRPSVLGNLINVPDHRFPSGPELYDLSLTSIKPPNQNSQFRRPDHPPPRPLLIFIKHAKLLSPPNAAGPAGPRINLGPLIPNPSSTKNLNLSSRTVSCITTQVQYLCLHHRHHRHHHTSR